MVNKKSGLFVMLFAISIGCLFLLSGCDNSIDELQNEIDELQEIMIDQEGLIEELQAEMNRVITENEGLLDDISELERQVEFWETSVMFGISSYFLTYIDIDEGYTVINYQSFSGDQLDFHQYTFRWYPALVEPPEDWSSIQNYTVVTNDGDVLGVVSNSHHGWAALELPTFGDETIIGVKSNATGSHIVYQYYIEREGQLINISPSSGIWNPTIDFESLEIRGWSTHYSGANAITIYHLIDDRLEEVKRLLWSGDQRIPQAFTAGEWVEIEYVESHWNWSDREHVRFWGMRNMSLEWLWGENPDYVPITELD